MKKVDKYFLIIFLAIQVNFFDIVDVKNSFLNTIMSYSQKKLLLIVIFFYVLGYFLLTKHRESKKNIFSFFISTLLISWIAVLVGSVNVFHQTFFSTFLVGYYFLILILYYVYSDILISWNSWIELTRIVNIFAFILAVTKLIQSFLYTHFNILILNFSSNLDEQTATSMRFISNGFTRIPSISDFIFFGMLLLLICMTAGKNVFSKKFEYLLVFVDLVSIFLVGQTRLYMMLSVLIVLLYVLIIAYKKFGADLYIFLAFVSVIPIGILLYKGFLKLFTGNDSRSVSLSIRQEAINYFWNHLTLNKWFSMGFAREDMYSTLLHGKYINSNSQVIQYNFDDVGIFGFIGRFGIIGLINVAIYVFALLKGFFSTKTKYIYLMGLVMVIGSWISVSLFDAQRIFYLPVLLALLNFLAFGDTTADEPNEWRNINE